MKFCITGFCGSSTSFLTSWVSECFFTALALAWSRALDSFAFVSCMHKGKVWIYQMSCQHSMETYNIVIPKTPIFKTKKKTNILWLETGSCRLQAHLHKLRTAQTPFCTCQSDLQIPEHILQTCTLFRGPRAQTWPQEKNIHRYRWKHTWRTLNDEDLWRWPVSSSKC